MPTVEVPTDVLEPVRLGVLRELMESAEDVRAELELLVESPGSGKAEDVRNLFESLALMVAMQDRVGWPGA